MTARTLISEYMPNDGRQEGQWHLAKCTLLSMEGLSCFKSVLMGVLWAGTPLLTVTAQTSLAGRAQVSNAVFQELCTLIGRC